MRLPMKLSLLWHFAATALLAVPSTGRAPELAMLDRLEKGSWELRGREDGSRQRICVRSGREFIQLRHPQPGCNQLIVQDEPDEITVQYTCSGSGYGRTTIRREGSGLIQVRSQGILNGTPFTLQGEARRQGRC